jgi:DNA repair protein RadC
MESIITKVFPEYKIQDRTLFIAEGLMRTTSSGEKTYTLRVKDLPDDEKPREKMLARGAGALSMAELLAVILNIGTKREGVLALSNRIMKEYGERNVLAERDPKKLASDLSITLGKALQIVAVGEIGRRSFLKNDKGAPTIRTARDVFEYAADMRMLSKEHLRGIYLNTHYKVIHDEVISIGTLDSSLIHPREVFKPALEYSAAAVILVHNHPSGIAFPNEADIAVTHQIAEAGKILGVDLIDHIIVTKDSFESIPL